MQYGSYTTVRELAAGPLATVYLATDDSARTKGQPRFAVKVFTATSSLTDWQTEETKNATADKANEFLRSTTRQKNAHAGGARHVAAIRDGGQSETGAWFATDHYPRTAQKLIEGRVALNRETIHHIISSAVRGALEFKTLTGEPHGNIKPANVLIGSASNLLRAQVVLIDPAPGGKESKDVLELSDLRAVGELIFRLVRRRDMSGADQWPIEMNLEWKAMFEDAAQQWLTLCNWLLDPNLSLGALNLEGLQNELGRLKPKDRGAWIKQAAVVGVVALLSLGVWWMIPSALQRKEKRLRAAMADVLTALTETDGHVRRNDWLKAQERITRALENSAAARTGSDAEPSLQQLMTELKDKEVILSDLKSKAMANAAACAESRANALDAERREVWAEALQAWKGAQSNCLTEPVIVSGIVFAQAMMETDEMLQQAREARRNGLGSTSNLFAQASAKLPDNSLRIGNVERGQAVNRRSEEIRNVLITFVRTNQPPQVLAKADRPAINVAERANLTGTVSDDGLGKPPGRVTVEWSQASGPGTARFANPKANDTPVSFDKVGAYELRLVATDGELSSSASVSVTVSMTNQPPVVVAKADRATINLAGRVNLTGTISDDGLGKPPGKVTVEWNQVSGPGPARFANPKTKDTTVNFDKVGAYELRLTASDGELSGRASVEVNVSMTNQAPVIVAKADRTAINVAERANLTGTVSDDGMGKPPGRVTVEWSQVSGVGTARFADAKNANTTVSFDKAGRYELRLTAGDGELNSSVSIELTVSMTNQPPVVVAKADRTTINLAERVNLTGTISDDGMGKPPGRVTVEWSQASGPGTARFANPRANDTMVNFDKVGAYELRLVATDGELSSSASVSVTVSMTNQPPLVVAKADRPAINVAERANLTGTISDDGLGKPPGKVTVEWSQVSGVGTARFADAKAANTTVSFDKAGRYDLRLTASDGELNSSASVEVTVSMTNQPPVVVAKADRPAINVAERANLTGTVSDDGLGKPPGRVTVEWSQVSGVGTARFADAKTADTTVEFDKAGAYELRLAANDGEFNSSASVQVIVSMANPKPEKVTNSVPVTPERTVSTAEIAALNTELKLYKIWFLREPPDGKILDPRTKRPAERMTTVGLSRETYKQLASRLKDRYERLGLLTPELQQTFKELLASIQIWP